ncbi:unnamed protein product, partial [Polarella glacialis]
ARARARARARTERHAALGPLGAMASMPRAFIAGHPREDRRRARSDAGETRRQRAAGGVAHTCRPLMHSTSGLGHLAARAGEGVRESAEEEEEAIADEEEEEEASVSEEAASSSVSFASAAEPQKPPTAASDATRPLHGQGSAVLALHLQRCLLLAAFEELGLCGPGVGLSTWCRCLGPFGMPSAE